MKYLFYIYGVVVGIAIGVLASLVYKTFRK